MATQSVGERRFVFQIGAAMFFVLCFAAVSSNWCTRKQFPASRPPFLGALVPFYVFSSRFPLPVPRFPFPIARFSFFIFSPYFPLPVCCVAGFEPIPDSRFLFSRVPHVKAEDGPIPAS